MMRDSKSNGKKPIEEVQAPRPRKYKLEHIGRKSPKCKRAEEALLSERNRFISIFEAMVDGVYIVNQEYDIEYVNPVLEKDFGSWEGRKCYEYFHDREESCSWCKNKDVFAGKTVRWEWYSFKNRKTYDLIDTPLKNPDGSISKLEIFRDITERKRAEDALRESEKKYKELFETSLDMIFMLDLDGNFTFANRAWSEHIEYPSDEVNKLNGFELIHPEDLESVRKRFSNVIEGKVEHNVEFRSRTKKGEYRNILINGSPVCDSEGNVIGVLGSGIDITEHKRAEKELKRSKEFLTNTINALDDPFFAKDEEHRWTVLNDAACEVMGRPREELIGKSDYDLFAKEQADVFWERDNLVLKNGVTDVNEEEITWHGKSHIISTKKSVLTDSLTGKKFIVGTIRDITERKKAEEALIESEEKFRNLAEQSPNMIFINKRRRVVYANKKCEEVMGYKREEFYHPDFDFMTLIAPEYTQLIKTNFSRHIKGEEIKPYEYGLITKDGKRLDTIITSKLMKYDGEDSILGTITDITERKKAQEEIAKLAKFPAEDPNPVLRISKDCTILYANNASSIVLDTWGRKVGERLPKACRERVEEVFRTGTASTFEFPCHNGQIFEVKLAPIVELGYTNAYGLDITERKKAELALQYRLDFEKLITSISTEFVNLRPDEIDKGINRALEAIGEFVGADRSYIFQYKDNTSKMDNTHEWCHEGIESHIHRLQNFCVDDFYVTREILKKSEVLHVSCLDDLPPEALADRQEFESEGIQSLICVPLVCGKSQVGFMGFDSVRTKKTWSQDEVALLKVVGEMLANALDRKQSEEALSESEERYREIVELAPDGIVTVNLKGIITSCNNALLKQTGYSKEDFVGRHISRIPTARLKDIPKYLKLFGSMLRGKVPKPFEFAWISKDGKEHWGEVHASILRRKGKAVGFQAITRNITERKKAEEKLKSSEERLKILFEAAPDGIYLNDLEGRFVDGNRAAEELVGYKREELIGKNFAEAGLLSAEQIPIAARSLNKVAHGQPAGPDEYTLKRKDESQVVVEIRAFPVRIGTETLSLGIARDISARRKAEEALRESEEKYRQLVSTTTDAVMLFDSKTRNILDVNKACEELYGYSREEFLNLRQNDITAELEKSEETIQKTVNRELKRIPVRYHKKKDGTVFPVEISVSTFELRGRKVLCGVIRDITERKKAEMMLSESEKRFRSLSEAAFEGIAFTEKGVLIDANEAFTKIVGYCLEELKGKKVIDLVAPDHRELVTENIRSGYEGIYEHKGLCKDGSLVDLEIQGRSVTYQGRKLRLTAIRDITKRKQSEEALSESEQKYRALVEQSLHGIVILQDYRVVLANKAATEISGLTIDEALSLSLEEMMAFIPPENRAATLERLKNRFAGMNEPENYELRLVRRNGEEFWLNLFFSPIEYQGKYAIQLAFVDITERKRAEEALQESESRFRELVENIREVFWMENAEGTELLYVSPTYEQIWGRSCQSFYDNPREWINAIHPDDRQRVVDAFNKFRETGGYSEEFRILRPDGSMRWIWDRGVLIHDESGQIRRIAGIAEDITQRKRIEEALQHEKELSDSVVESSVDGILAFDDKCRYTIWNSGMKRISGVSREEALGQCAFEVFPFLKETGEDRFFFDALEGKTVIAKDRPYRVPETQRQGFFEGHYCPLCNEQGEIKGGLAIIRDITERKHAEERLLEYQEQLKSLASQLTLAEERERRRIAIELHDEISQSLFISKMKLEALHKSASDKKLNDTLDEINNSLGRIMAAMRSLTFDLSSPILYEFGFEEAVAEWLNERVEKKYGIATEFEDDNSFKPLDDDIRVLLFRNVRELLINVVKHAHASKVKVSIGKVGGRIRVSVEDDGLGFEPAKAESMITKKEAFGLFSIRERLEYLGGDLKIDSAPGCGCRVTITSPLKREDINKDK